MPRHRNGHTAPPKSANEIRIDSLSEKLETQINITNQLAEEMRELRDKLEAISRHFKGSFIE